MSIGAPPHEKPAAESGRADSASASPSTARPTIGSTGRRSGEYEHEVEGSVGWGTSSAPSAAALRWRRSRQEGETI
jgi:hypothetical protein